MMTQKKRFLIVIVIILLILLLLGGVFAYLYFATDLFKTNQQLFFKYLSQNSDVANFMPDTNYIQQKQTLSQRPYEFSGDVTFECSNVPDSDIYNQISIAFEGKNDATNQKRKQTTTIKNGEESIFEWNYLKNGNLEALASDEVVNKYVAMESPSLSKVLALFGNNILSSMTTEQVTVDFSAFNTFNEQEKKELQQKYLPIFLNEIPAESYQKQKDVVITLGDEKLTTNQYEITLSETELSKVTIALLETLRDDQVLLGKIQQATQNSLTIENLQELCDNAINEKKRENTTDEQALYLAVFEKDGTLVKTQVQIENYEIEWQLQKQAEGDILSSIIRQADNVIATIEVEKKKQQQEYDMAVVIYNNGEEAIKVVLQYSDTTDTAAQTSKASTILGINVMGSVVQVQYEGQKNYKGQVEIEDLTENNSVNISEYSKQEAQNLLFSIQNRMEQLYTDKIIALGLASNSVFSPDKVINLTRQWLPAQYSEKVSDTSNIELDEQMIHAFNGKFELYTTLEKNEKTTEGIIRTTYEHNKNYQDEPEKQVNLLINNQDFGNLQNYVLEDLITQVKNASFSYIISFDYDEVTKLIKNVKLTV